MSVYAYNRITFYHVTDKKKLRDMIESMLKNYYSEESQTYNILYMDIRIRKNEDGSFYSWEEKGENLEFGFSYPKNWSYFASCTCFDFLIYLKLCDKVTISYEPDQEYDYELYLMEYDEGENGVMHWKTTMPVETMNEIARKNFNSSESGYDDFDEYLSDCEEEIYREICEKTIENFDFDDPWKPMM